MRAYLCFAHFTTKNCVRFVVCGSKLLTFVVLFSEEKLPKDLIGFSETEKQDQS